MKKSIFSLHLAIIALSCALSTKVAEAAPEPCHKCYTIIYGNGMGSNDTAQWDHERDTLSKAIGDTFESTRIVYATAANPSGDMLAIYRALRQKLAEVKGSGDLSWELIGRIIFNVAPLAHLLPNTDVHAVLGEPGAAGPQYTDHILVKQVETLREALVAQQQRVVLVGYSQGSLYANFNYQALRQYPDVPIANLKLASVASVAKSVAGGGRYITSTNDQTVNWVRVLFPRTLPGNISVPFHPADRAGHLFVPTYLAENLPARSAVQNMIRDSLADLAAVVDR